MQPLLAAEGGFQEFTLGGAEWGLLAFCAATAVLALLVGLVMMKGVLAKETGTPEMGEIAGAVQEGAMAYIKRQFRTIGVIVVPLAVIVFLTSQAVEKPVADSDMSGALSFVASGAFRTIAFVVGALASGFIGFLGMWLSTRANLRTAAAARTGSMNAAMQVAFRSGGTIGMFTAGLGLLGATLIVMIFRNTASAILVGFGFGGSLLALFLRVGGGIFTKAADVGADLVGKVEAGIPEDDPRNPATIADNVGDNVGDCAGMAADLFESFGVTIVASVILGVSAFRDINIRGEAAKGLIFPLAIMAVGILASLVAIYMVKARPQETDALKPINRGLTIASVLALIGTALIAFLYVGNPEKGDLSQVGTRMFAAVVAGVVLGQVASRITQYFTSSSFKPVRDIANSGKTGPATVVLSGISSGLESAVWAAVAIGGAIMVALGLAGGELQFGLYLVALTGIGMLSTTAIVVAEDTFGPIADNAQGIAEMSGVLEGETETILDGLDTVGNTTKAVTKGFAIGSAVIAAVALFASFIETIYEESVTGAMRAAGNAFESVAINIAEPKTFVGGLLGGTVVFLFSSLAILAVGRTAGVVVEEVRKQFREKPGIMDYTEKPDYGPVIDICTTSALRELTTPALLAVLMPVAVGFGLNKYALGGYLVASIIAGQLMANFLSNSGGAWDNAKKYVEEGNHGGKGSDVHKAVVIGDTVGDPFKDTAGPAINPLLKVMNLVSLLVLPAIISLEDNNVRYLIAAAAVAVIIGGVLFSKRSSEEVSVPA